MNTALNTYRIHTNVEGTRGMDWETNLVFEVPRAVPPEFLVDFGGGEVTYSTGRGQGGQWKASIAPCPTDPTRAIQFLNPGGILWVIYSAYEEYGLPLNQSVVAPLRQGQRLHSSVENALNIFHANWSLPQSRPKRPS